MNPQVQVTKALCQGRGPDHHLHGRIMFCVWHEERPRRFLITVREYLTLSLPVPGSGACFAGADPGTDRVQAVRTGPVRTKACFSARFNNTLKTRSFRMITTEQTYGFYKCLKLKASFRVPYILSFGTFSAQNGHFQTINTGILKSCRF